MELVSSGGAGMPLLSASVDREIVVNGSSRKVRHSWRQHSDGRAKVTSVLFNINNSSGTLTLRESVNNNLAELDDKCSEHAEELRSWAEKEKIVTPIAEEQPCHKRGRSEVEINPAIAAAAAAAGDSDTVARSGRRSPQLTASAVSSCCTRRPRCILRPTHCTVRSTPPLLYYGSCRVSTASCTLPVGVLLYDTAVPASCSNIIKLTTSTDCLFFYPCQYILEYRV